MKRKKRHLFRHLALFGILLSSMTLLGVSYAAWNSGLTIKASLTTGDMDIRFNEEGCPAYSVYLVDPEEKKLQELAVKIEFKEEGKYADILFEEGVPVESLAQGNRLCIDFSMKTGSDNSITLIRKKPVQWDKPDEQIEMKAERGMIVKGQRLYSLEAQTHTLMRPLMFDLYREIQTQDEKMMGKIYFQLREESIQQIEQSPKFFALDVDALEEYPIVHPEEQKIAEQMEEGVAILYSCEIPFMVDQKDMKLGSD